MKTPSQKQEADIAKALDGRVTPASGAFWHRKGDVGNEFFLVEAKQTDKKSISVSKEVWEKIRREALLTGRIPLLALRIQDRDLVVLDMDDFIGSTPESWGDLPEGGLP